MNPDKSYIKSLDYTEADFNETTVALYSEDGKELDLYKPYQRGQKKPIDVLKSLTSLSA